MNNTNENTNVKKIILEFIEHNPRHFLKIKIFKKTIHPCARCFGIWIGLITGFILFSPFWIGIFQIKNFFLIFTIAWIFAIPTILLLKSKV